MKTEIRILVFGAATIVVSLLIHALLTGTAVQGQEAIHPAMQDGAPVHVYMIQDTGKNLWYRRIPPANLVGWGSQQESMVWTDKKLAERAHKILFGNRKTVIRAFLLLPVEDK